MSRSIGHELPRPLLARLDGSDLPSRLGRAFLVISVDAHGFPHPALLSYGELVALDRFRLRLAMYDGSRSSTHLRTQGKVTICLVDEELAHYIKGSAVAIPGMRQYPRLARFEIQIEDILEDRAGEDEAGARITGGITFARAESDADTLASWEAVLSALRAPAVLSA